MSSKLRAPSSPNKYWSLISQIKQQKTRIRKWKKQSTTTNYSSEDKKQRIRWYINIRNENEKLKEHLEYSLIQGIIIGLVSVVSEIYCLIPDYKFDLT